MILPPITYLLLNIAHAGYHAHLIKKGKVILSRQKVLEYGLACIVVTIVFLLLKFNIWPLIIIPLLTRAAVFDPCLNLFRGKGWLYEGQISKKKSFVDWIESWIGLPTWVFRIVYLLIYVGYLIYYYAT